MNVFVARSFDKWRVIYQGRIILRVNGAFSSTLSKIIALLSKEVFYCHAHFPNLFPDLSISFGAPVKVFWCSFSSRYTGTVRCKMLFSPFWVDTHTTFLFSRSASKNITIHRKRPATQILGLYVDTFSFWRFQPMGKLKSYVNQSYSCTNMASRFLTIA